MPLMQLGTIHVFSTQRIADRANSAELRFREGDVEVCYGSALGAFQAARAILHDAPSCGGDLDWVNQNLVCRLKPGGGVFHKYLGDLPRHKVDHPTERDLGKLGGPSRQPIRIGGKPFEYSGPGTLKSMRWGSDGRLELIIEGVFPQD